MYINVFVLTSVCIRTKTAIYVGQYISLISYIFMNVFIIGKCYER